jgi:hypothetical protein
MPSSPWIRDILGVYCPACGAQKLHLMQSDVIHCLAPGCPNPDAAQKILSDPETRDVVEFTGDDFRILHPLRERIGGSLFDCPVHQALQHMAGPPESAPGRYRARLDEDGKLLLEPLAPEGT